MKAIGLLFVAAMLFAPSARADDEKSRSERDPWNGFGIGSWIIHSESVTVDGKINTKKEKRTRIETKLGTGINVLVKLEGKNPGEFDGKESTQIHISGFDPDLNPKIKVLETKSEDLTIQKKKFAVKSKNMT